MEDKNQKFVIIHYDEIGLKGGNRNYFERKLIDNIKESVPVKNAINERGQIIIELEDNFNRDEIINILSCVPGISSFSFSIKCEKELQDIVEKTEELCEKHNKKDSKKKSKEKSTNKTFKLDTRRHDKSFPLKSTEINSQVGEVIVKKFGFNVRMRDPELIIKIEICNRFVFISDNNYKGLSGLPVGTAGKMLSLLSGGIDSPVSSFLMMKRGVSVKFIHFQNKTNMKRAVSDKIKKLAKKLSKFQGKSILYIVPFEKIQQEIIIKVPAKYRMIIYRRFMVRIAEKLAKKEKILSLVTGDSLSQVASQTLENLNCVHKAASDVMIFSPLIGTNKIDTINIAKEIGTYEISIEPYNDCCSFFIAKNPETKANLYQIEKIEKNLDVEKLVNLGLNGIEKHNIKP